MNSKYSDLPDIDLTNQDVFESDDLPVEPLNNKDSDSDSDLFPSKRSINPANTNQENFDYNHLDITQSRNKFKDKLLDQNNRRLPSTNYYSLSYRHSHLTRPNSTSAEEAEAKETNLERLRRLRFEVEELEDDVRRDEATVGIVDASGMTDEEKKGKGKGRQISPAIILQQLQLLRGDLSHLKLSEEVDDGLTATGERNGSVLKQQAQASSTLLSSLQTGPSASSSASTSALHQKGAQIASKESGTVETGDLEARLSQMEKVIGASVADVDESFPLGQPLIQTMNRLDHLLTVLTQPRHLDSISRRVKVLVSDLERLHDSRRKLGDTRPLNVALGGGMTAVAGENGDGDMAMMDPSLPPDALQKINTLFALLPRLDPLLPLTPRLLTRLGSLSSLHASAASFSTTLNSIQAEVSRLSEGEAGLKEILTGLEGSMNDNSNKVKRNLGGLEERIQSVVQRMDQLGV